MTSAQKRDALDTAYDSWYEDQLEDETPEKYCDRCHKLTDEYREQSGKILCEKCIRELERNAQPAPTPQRTPFDDEAITIQESIANGDFEIEDLKSTRLGATVSAQFDETNGTLLLATNETQVLLSALETQALMCFLHDERDALYVALHKEFHSKYI